ncbi:hypothetical protein [Nonomuraea jabiensis]|uniref:Uncharacterized protein n=1 Tax=Nonomuraea jabiensis TaxID=882448 RepID=A0A7W9GDX7_9ACTN|nr:hypothetical protein [Nonomuraea jabiensis]MBB5782043.1 hypothetical protein [Nonomuraea jabiensis]
MACRTTPDASVAPVTISVTALPVTAVAVTPLIIGVVGTPILGPVISPVISPVAGVRAGRLRFGASARARTAGPASFCACR